MNIHERKKLKESTLNRNIMNVRGGGMNGPSLEKINKSSDKLIRSNLPSPSKLRHTVFPIYGKDVKKFLLIGCIKFFIIMALTLTRDMKDTMIVTQCGAEAITFLKIYGVLPAAAAFIALYTKLSSMLGKERLFYTTCIPFFVFFLFFDYVVYPYRGIIQPSLEVTKSILGDRSGANEVLSNIFLNWTSGLYFVVAEIFSSVSVGILFWQTANDLVHVDQAKRFYPLFAQMSGLAPIFAGQFVSRYSSKASDFGSSLHRVTMAVSVTGIMICVFYHLSMSFVHKENNVAEVRLSSTKPKSVKKKEKMSIRESFSFLSSSHYLKLIGTLVIGYGLSINFTEILWKSLVKKKYPDPLDYQRFMGNFSSAVGLGTSIIIFFGVHLIRVLGWSVGALATPVIMSLLALPFFVCIFTGVDSPSRLTLAVILGTLQSFLSKTCKNALFDPTTQMAYIPLDEELKVKGKAAIDVLGSRLGKSGGSLIQQGLVLVFGNIINASPALAVIFYAVLFGWISAVKSLNTLFTETQKAEKRDK